MLLQNANCMCVRVMRCSRGRWCEDQDVLRIYPVDDGYNRRRVTHSSRSEGAFVLGV